jgi:hypothetical protein
VLVGIVKMAAIFNAIAAKLPHSSSSAKKQAPKIAVYDLSAAAYRSLQTLVVEAAVTAVASSSGEEGEGGEATQTQQDANTPPSTSPTYNPAEADINIMSENLAVSI